MLRVTPLWDLCCWLSGPLHCPENQEPGGEEWLCGRVGKAGASRSSFFDLESVRRRSKKRRVCNR